MGHVLRGWATTMAWLAAVWAVVFAGWHVYWASGGTVGLGAGAEAGLRSWIPLHDPIAVTLCMLMALLATAIARSPRDPAWAHRLRVLAAWVGAVLLIRGVAGLVQLAWWFALDRSHLDASAVWDPYYVEGGLLFLAAAGIGVGGRPRRPVEARRPAEPARR